MNVCAKFHPSPLRRCWDILLVKKFELIVNSEELQASSVHSVGTMNVSAIFHDKPVNICWDILSLDQSDGSQTDWLTVSHQELLARL